MMPRFAANLTMLFTELPMLDRFAAAADAVEELEETCDKFEVAKQKRLEREAKRAERLSAKKVLASSPS